MIDLEDDTDLFTEDDEVIKLRNMVIAKLSVEETYTYKCRASDYQSK